MRWKLIRRRLSVTAPRMIVRRHLPWPLRWALAAVVLGFSAAIALWAFEFGKDIAGLDRGLKDELAQLRVEVQQLRDEREKNQSIANTAESLLRTERAAQEGLQQQLRQLADENLAMKADLGFFERLLPAQQEGLSVRGLRAEPAAPGRLRYQLLVTQSGKAPPEFKGRCEIVLTGVQAGRPWTQSIRGDEARPLRVRQYARVEGSIDHPVDAVVKTLQVKVIDAEGSARATLTVKL